MARNAHLEQHRKLEEAAHQNLHENLSLLMVKYEPSSGLKEHFKQGMFAKSNPGVFLHVMHFLLNVIDPVAFRNNFQWPLYDKSMETKFKTTLRSYLSDLDKKFPLAGLGPIKVSYVVTPGGYQFTDFIINLSNLAIVIHLQRTGKNPFVPKGENPESDKAIILDEIEKTELRIKALITARNKLHEENINETELIKKGIEDVEKNIDKRKHNWKGYILSMANLSQVEKDTLICDPVSVISKLKSELSVKLNDVEHLTNLLSKKATFYKETAEISSIILQRYGKGHCLQYDNELKDLMPLRKYIAVKNIPLVDQVVENYSLNLPILFSCLKSAFDQIKPMVHKTETDVEALLSIQESLKALDEILAQFKNLGAQVVELKNSVQISLDEARINFEKMIKKNSSMTSLVSFLPEPSPCGNFKWFKNNSDMPKSNLKEVQTGSMIDMNKISKNSGRAYQPDWFKPSIMTAKKSRPKVLEKSSQKYRSTPCLSSPMCKKKLVLALDFNSSNDKSSEEGSVSFLPNSSTLNNTKESSVLNESSASKILHKSMTNLSELSIDVQSSTKTQNIVSKMSDIPIVKEATPAIHKEILRKDAQDDTIFTPSKSTHLHGSLLIQDLKTRNIFSTITDIPIVNETTPVIYKELLRKEEQADIITPLKPTHLHGSFLVQGTKTQNIVSKISEVPLESPEEIIRKKEQVETPLATHEDILKKKEEVETPSNTTHLLGSLQGTKTQNVVNKISVIPIVNEMTPDTYKEILRKKEQVEIIITPPKPTRRSIIEASVGKRLSCIADEMPIPNLGSYNDELFNNSINFSPLGYKSPDIPIGKLISLSFTEEGNCKPLYNRFSLGPLIDDCAENLMNISEDHLLIDSD